MFTRSFDNPSKLYLPGERNKAEREAAAAAEAAEAAEREHQAAELARKQAAPKKTAEPPKPPEEKKEYTKAQLDAAREEGHIAGHTAALEEAETAREHYIADAMNLIAVGLDGLQSAQDVANKQTADLAMRMVFAVVQRLLPEYAHHYAVDNIESFVRHVLPLAMGEPRLSVRAHAMIAPDIEVRLKEVFTRTAFQGTYTVISDYELQPGDCKLEWAGGGADRDEGRIWADIREVIAGNVGEADADTLDAAADAALTQKDTVAQDDSPTTEQETNAADATADMPDVEMPEDTLADTEADATEENSDELKP